jgi:hypothetical protein
MEGRLESTVLGVEYVVSSLANDSADVMKPMKPKPIAFVSL